MRSIHQPDHLLILLAVAIVGFFEPQHAFLRDRTVFLVRLNKNGSQKRDKGMPGPLTIEVQAHPNIYQ